jgi:hypothetical protein
MAQSAGKAPEAVAPEVQVSEHGLKADAISLEVLQARAVLQARREVVDPRVLEEAPAVAGGAG